MGKTIVNEIEKCTQCPHCTILPDPEPYDWFCDDDVKLFCEKLKRTITGNINFVTFVGSKCSGYCPF